MSGPVSAWQRTLRAVPHESGRRYVLDQGSGNRTVVLLHGIPSYNVLWRDVARELARVSRVVAPDLTGFGLSDPPPNADLSPRGQARDLLCLLDELRIERFALVGHDYGALVACELLALEPRRVTHLVITNTSLRPADWTGSGFGPFQLLKLPGVGELAFALARPVMLKAAYALYVAERRRLDEELMELLWAPFERGFDRTLLKLFRQRPLDRRDAERWRRALSGFGGRALVVWGARDPTFRVDRGEEIRALLKRAELVILDGSNHFVPIDRPRVLARLIRRLLTESG